MTRDDLSHRVWLALFGTLLFWLLSLSCGLVSDMPKSIYATSTLASTIAPTTTPTITPTATPTITPTSTLTFTPTPTITPDLLTRENLAKIALQQSDIESYLKKLRISPEKYVITSTSSAWRSWNNEIPVADEKSSFTIAYEINQQTLDNRLVYVGTHYNSIIVFHSSEEARAFFSSDISYVNSRFIENMGDIPSIGDEVVAFRAWKYGTWPAGGIIWRFKNIYIFYFAESPRFDYSKQALVSVANKIQERLENLIP